MDMKDNMLNTVLCTVLLLLVGIAGGSAQSSNVKKMKKKAEALRKDIDRQNKILLSTQDDVNSQLRDLKVLEDRISWQKELLDVMRGEVNAIEQDIEQIGADIAIQEERVAESREEYAEALRRARKYGKAKSKLAFIMAADDFRTMTRRYRYANTYMDAHARLAKSLQAQIDILDKKNSELQHIRDERAAALKEEETVAAELQEMEKAQQKNVNDLKKKSSKLKAEIKKKQQDLDKQNRLIDKEIDRILKEEEAARKKAEAERKKSAGSKPSKGNAGKKSSYASDAGVAAMTGSFEKNKKKMPIPITGSYVVVERYGTQNVIGSNGVKLKNNGITFEGTSGAKARCIFDGDVLRVLDEGNYHFVLIRHGDYMTVYCNIEKLNVKEGDKVKAGDILGTVGIDPKHNVPRMQFQMRKKRTILDPAQWLKM